MDQPNPPRHDALKRLDEQIASLKEGEKPQKRPSGSAEQQALRMVSDFAAACLVSAGAGYGVDIWLNTSPFGLLIGLFLGLITGTKLLLDAESRVKDHSATSENEEKTKQKD